VPRGSTLKSKSGQRHGRSTLKEVGGKHHREYWIPAEDLGAFNEAIIGEIEVVAEFE